MHQSKIISRRRTRGWANRKWEKKDSWLQVQLQHALVETDWKKRLDSGKDFLDAESIKGGEDTEDRRRDVAKKNGTVQIARRKKRGFKGEDEYAERVNDKRNAAQNDKILCHFQGRGGSGTPRWSS